MLRSPPRQGGAVPGGWNGADCEEKVGRLSATRKEFRSIWGYRTVAGLVIRSQSRGQSCWTWVKRAFILPIHLSHPRWRDP